MQEVDCKTVRIFARGVKQKVWTEAENREREWAETLKLLSPHTPYGHVRLTRLAGVRLTPRFTDFFTDFEKQKAKKQNKTTVLQSMQDVTKIPFLQRK